MSSDSESSAAPIGRKRPRRNIECPSRNRARAVYTHFKRYLVSEECPVSFEPYFDVVGYQTKHRTFMDFELPYLYVENIDARIPGTLAAFLKYLNQKKRELLGTLAVKYGRTKLKYYKDCVMRMYKAFNSGESTLGRIRILYQGYKTKAFAVQLDDIWKRLAEKTANYK
jgi:hypothetical protein